MADAAGPTPLVVSVDGERLRPASSPAIGDSFENVVLPHLDAAYRLARWLMRNEHDAEDVVQEASLRAFRYFRTFTGGSGRAWFLRIVRNTCSRWHGHRVDTIDAFDEERHSHLRPPADPEMLLLQTDAAAVVEQTLRRLPDRHRELLVLRELEGLSYRELADVMGIPIGTVMSGLSRARQAFRGALNDQLTGDGSPKRTRPQEQEAEEALV
jgi:RNA polymerase sigma-70 factor, ECF subfamily